MNYSLQDVHELKFYVTKKSLYTDLIVTVGLALRLITDERV